MKNFALAGNPNCGKTTLFNSLTGSTAHVGNWPGVTVDKKVGVCSLGKEKVNIIDLPGIYSLSPYTPEEVITRNYIIDEKPDCLINIIDTTNLERNLYLTTQLMEMDVPIIIALNMMDILEKNGDSIDPKLLSRELGVPVIPISALKENNLKNLIDEAIKESKNIREGSSILLETKLKHLITDLTIAFHSLGVSDPIFHATKLAELDELEAKNHPELVHMVEHFRKENLENGLNEDYEAFIADARYKHITSRYAIALTRANKNIKEIKKQDKIDMVLTHKYWGIPIFIAILFLIFHLVFSENFLFLGGLINKDNFSNISDSSLWYGFKGLFYTTGGINSPGVILSNALNGLTGALSKIIRNSLSHSKPWVSGLICDGVLSGVFSILGFLPQILLLFLLFSILEDSGYMARVAFILDRIFRKFGLSGRAFLPMIMGFGCSVPAMINTRTIADEKERIATLRVIPFFSCGAKLPILTAIGGCIVQSTGIAPGLVDVITLSMYLLGMLTAIVTVLLMRNTTLKGKSSPFIMELPAYHFPQPKSTALLVWDKAKHFIQKAFTIILASTIIIWFISHFSFDWKYVDTNMDLSILAGFGKLIKPLFIPLGFGVLPYGWLFVVAAFTGLIAKENVVATMGTLAASILTTVGLTSGNGNENINLFVNALKDINSPLFNQFFADHSVAILLSFVALNMLTIPCSATVATAKGEMNKKTFKYTIVFWIIVSFIVSSAIFVIGSWWWTSFIYLAILIISFVLIKIIQKKHELKEKLTL